jgi:hypothetical protein
VNGALLLDVLDGKWAVTLDAAAPDGLALVSSGRAPPPR